MGEDAGAKIAVVAALVVREGRFLVGKRSTHKAVAPGYWCPVTGRIEPGESAAAAIVREVHEETGLVVRAIEQVARTETRDGSAVIAWWWAAPLDEAPARLLGTEHTELRWVTPAELQNLEPVFPEDVAILAQLAARLGSR